MCLYYFVSSKEQTPTICFLFLLLRTYQGSFAEQRYCEFKSLPLESQKTLHSFQTQFLPLSKYLVAKFQKALLTVLSLNTFCLFKVTQDIGGRRHPLSPDKVLSPSCLSHPFPQSHIRAVIPPPLTTDNWSLT